MTSALAMADPNASYELDKTTILARLPVELKLQVLELVVGDDKKLALELACKSSACRQWYANVLS
jgi:hypothetical protein